MAIKAPSYQKDAIPTRKGWIHPNTGETLVGGSISQKDIDEYLGVKIDSIKAEVAQAQEVQIDIIEDDLITIDVEDDSEIDWEIEEIDLDSMTKAELIETAEEWEIDIDPKSTKAVIKEVLEQELN
jgi:nucleoid DNA-binding protein